jgi:hypothetical protein
MKIPFFWGQDTSIVGRGDSDGVLLAWLLLLNNLAEFRVL